MARRTIYGLLLVLWAMAYSPASSAQAKELVIDLADSLVQITLGFAGTDLLLFGAKTGPGDIVVVVRGPRQNEIIRRREKVAGIWVNRGSVVFDRIPAFYWLGSNRPIEEFLGDDVRRAHQIGVDYLDLFPTPDQPIVEEFETYHDALIRNKRRLGLYSEIPGTLRFVSDILFRTRVDIPANVTVGTFGIDAYLIRDGAVAGFETTLLDVRKFGVEARIFDFAHRHAAAYGVLAILIAAVAGWLANIAFRKV